MNGRLKLVVTARSVTKRRRDSDDDKLLSKVDPPKGEMATLEIPSLPSSDLNHMLKYVMSPTRQYHRAWPLRSPAEDEGERSPEPRTPRFGANVSPSFAESNAQFGFNFQTPFSKPDPKPETVSVQTNSTIADTEHVLVSDNIQSSTGMNIPTTVMDKSGDPPKKSEASELPTILLSDGDGKPASFIRFLNDPIPVNTVNVEHEEMHTDNYSNGYQIVSDLDAIQRVEDEPVDSVQITSDQCVPGSAGVQFYEVISDDRSSPSQSELLGDVAAYQSVEDTPTYTMLQPRKVPDGSFPLTIPESLSTTLDSTLLESEVTTEPMTISERLTSNHQTLHPKTNMFPNSEQLEEDVEKLNKDITKDLEAALQSAPEENKVQILVKNELKHKIQLKRLQEGKGMLRVSFEERPMGEPTEEEKKKAHNRKMKNRESAVRSRQRRQEQMNMLEKEVKSLERENKQLMREIREIKEENLKIEKSICPCLKNNQPALGQTVLFLSPRSQLEDERSPETLSEAIENLLASEGRT